MWFPLRIPSHRSRRTSCFPARSRRSWPLLLLTLTLPLLLSGCGSLAFVQPSQPSPTRASTASDSGPHDYLALGDSIAFGYSPLLKATDASDFTGYPTPIARALGLTLTNAACPGATSGYLVSLDGPDWQCASYRSVYPLHVSYGVSQLDFAVSFLRAHPDTRLVTIDIGVNDLFRLQSRECDRSISCVQQNLPQTLAAIAANLDTIYGAIRTTAGYHYQIAALTYYSTDYAATGYTDPVTATIARALDQVIAARTLAWGGVVADGFHAFAVASAQDNGDPCAAGLLIALPAGGCDLHPSARGRDILASVVLAVVRRNLNRPVAA